MTRFLHKRMWLAGASLLAILIGSGNADAVVFGGPQGVDYIIPATGYYDFKVAGADDEGLAAELALLWVASCFSTRAKHLTLSSAKPARARLTEG
jgi:hypothetical protein